MRAKAQANLGMDRSHPNWRFRSGNNNQERCSIVKNCIFRSLAVALVFGVFSAVGISGIGLAQRSRAVSPAKEVPTLLSSLPPSDAVALINVNRVLDEAMPKLLAENPAKLAELNTE